MRRTIRALASAATAAALVVAVHAQSKAAVAKAPDISGIWKLNADLSDQGSGTPNDRPEGRGGDEGGGRRGGGFGGGFGGRGGGMRGGGMRGGGMGPGGAGGRMDPEQMKKTRDFMQAVLAAPNSVTIAQHDDEISFTDDQGQVTKIQPNGKEEKHVFGSETGKTKTKWNGDQLVIEISGEGNAPKITRTYSLVQGPDGAKQLRLVTSMEGRGQQGRQRTITKVYEPAAE